MDLTPPTAAEPSTPPTAGGTGPGSRDETAWARPVGALAVGQVPAGALNLNVVGRRLSGPIQGFGSLWQKTYQVRLGDAVSIGEVMATFRTELPSLQPPQNRFFPSVAGVAPGEVVLINARISGLPVSTGVLVLYADDEAFTLMTPEGHPESGWVTFSAFRDGDSTIAQIQSMSRAADPIYEIGFRFMGGSRSQEAIWRHVLVALAARFEVRAEVELTKNRVDPGLQWRHARNVWRNAIVRTTLYRVAAPARWAMRPFRRRNSQP